jgi:hypothetical protein
MEWSGMESNGMEWSGTIPLFGYFIKKKNKL